jgi:hypothetical protein
MTHDGMAHDEMKPRAEALARWTQAHGSAATECPICAGVTWVFRFEHAGAFMPRACSCCGYVKWFDAKRLGLEPAPGADRAGPRRQRRSDGARTGERCRAGQPGEFLHGFRRGAAPGFRTGHSSTTFVGVSDRCALRILAWLPRSIRPERVGTTQPRGCIGRTWAAFKVMAGWRLRANPGH